MSKIKLEHGVSRIRHAKLQSSIDQTIADDIELMAEWSNNETNYVVNELLRFALANEEDFQKYKASAAMTERASVTPSPSPPSMPTSACSRAGRHPAKVQFPPRSSIKNIRSRSSRKKSSSI